MAAGSVNSSPPSPENIRALIAENLVELPEDFAPEADLFAAGLDSMAIMQLLLLLEEQCGARIPMGEVTGENFGSTAAIARLVAAKSGGDGAGE